MIKWIYYYFLIRRSGLFDSGYYLKNYQDVRKADVNPLWHFVRLGWKEGRNPSSIFDTNFYMRNNWDVRQLNVNPLIHYIKFGKEEGRQPRAKSNSIYPSPGFNGGSEQNSTRISNRSRQKSVIDDPKSAFQEPTDALLEDSVLLVPQEPINKYMHTILNVVTSYQKKISVIIPTKNAGVDFEYLLKVLINQEGFAAIEIIIVDSGSTDNTLDIANAYQAKVIKILPEEFSHSFARNLGAENATGDYLLFTVQDALPPTKTWLYELISVLNNNDVCAVSCAELPRENADLFYRIISWNHYNFLDVNGTDRIFTMPENSNYMSLRKNGQLSDVACLIPRELFLNYKYRFNYAEDLDLGIRLIEDGNKIAFLGSVRIIHSHNRSPYYFLKRGYVDNLFLSDIFDDFPVPAVDFKDTVADILFAYNFVNSEISNKLSKLNKPIEVGNVENLIRRTLNSSSNFKYPSMADIQKISDVDGELAFFLNKLANISKYNEFGMRYAGSLMKNLKGFINITFSYLNSSNDFIDKNLAEEIKLCIFKEVSILSGAHLAYCYIDESLSEHVFVQEIHSILKDGI